MNKFIEKFASHLKGVLTGFDRLVFRGHLRRMVYREGMMSYLWQQKVLLKQFGQQSPDQAGFLAGGRTIPARLHSP